MLFRAKTSDSGFWRPAVGRHGIFTAHEISQMNSSNTELVLMLGCETDLIGVPANGLKIE